MKYQVLIKFISNGLSCSGYLDTDTFDDRITDSVVVFFLRLQIAFNSPWSGWQLPV